jgi:hypothetical protein
VSGEREKERESAFVFYSIDLIDPKKKKKHFLVVLRALCLLTVHALCH